MKDLFADCPSFGEMMVKSARTRVMLDDCEEQGYLLGLQPKKMYCSIDKDNRLDFYNLLMQELEAKWQNPVIVCFINYDPKTKTRVHVWCQYQKKYILKNVEVLCTEEALKCGLSTERQPFNGAHFCARTNTDVVITDTMLVSVGIGFYFKKELYIVDHGSNMNLEDDCLSFGTFDVEKNYAEMRVSGSGWH